MNAMNQGNFQPMGAQSMGPPQMVQQGGNSITMKHYIFQSLQEQTVPQGWQRTFRVEHRALNIHQIISQLLLVKPGMTMPQAFNVAAEFERREFNHSVDQTTYELHCRNKLTAITQARQNQANLQSQQFQNAQTSQMNLAQQQMQAQGMFPNQHQSRESFGFPQPQQPIQTPNMHVNQMTQQQQQQQQQQQVQGGNAMGVPQVFSNVQPMSNVPQQILQNRVQQSYTPQDQTRIQQIAQHMAQNMSAEDKGNLARTVQNMPEGLKQQLGARGMNPMHYILRQEATKRFMHERNSMAAQRSNLAVTTGNGAVSQGRPASQASMRPQIQQPQQSQLLDQSSAAGNIDQILGQQQEALRHQEAGQVVVPASNGQRVGEQQRAPSRIQRTAQQQTQAQFGSNPPMQIPNNFQQQPQPLWNNMQAQPHSIQQTAQMQMQPPTPNFASMPAQITQQQSLQGQLGGLNNNMGIPTPQQNHVMPTLNQPMDPPGQGKNVPSTMPAQPTPRAGQRAGQNVPSGQQRVGPAGQSTAAQQRPGAASNVPPKSAMPLKMQQHMAKLSDEDRKKFIIEMQARQQEMKRKHAEASSASMARNAQVGGQQVQGGTQAATGVQNGQAMVTQAMMTPNPMISQQGAPNRPNQRTQQPNPHELNFFIQQEAAKPQYPLTDEQAAQMDCIPYPTGILNATSPLTRLPDSVKTWGQLKQWVNRNAQTLPPDSLRKVKDLQGRHYSMMLEAKNINQGQMQPGNTYPQQMGSAPPAQMIPPRINPTPMQGVYSAPTGQMSMPLVNQLTPQDIQTVRNHLQGAGTMTDDQIRTVILNKRYRDRYNAAQGQQAMNQQQLQYNNMLRTQQAQQNPGQAFKNAQTQSQQPSQIPQPQQGQQWPQQNARPQSAQQSQQPPMNRAGTQGNQKGVKRSNTDEVIEVPNPKLVQQQPRSTTKQAPSASLPMNGMPQFTAAQLASMTKEQKANFETFRRNANQRTAMQAQRPQAIPGQPSVESAVQKPRQAEASFIRVKQLEVEVRRSLSLPSRPSIPMSPKTRGRIIQKLRDTKAMLNRIDVSLPVFLGITKDEEKTKDMIRTRIILVEQVQHDDFSPVENFTISMDELDQRIAELHQYFDFMVNAVSSGQVDVPPAGKNPAQAASQPQHQQLNAANLQQQQEALQRNRAASVQKNQSNRPPAAPTTSHAPFSFRGGQSPQGVPQFYGPKNELTQEKLHLPASKKRKNHPVASAESTPAQTQLTPGPQSSPLGIKVESPETQRVPVPALLKCPVPSCKISGGFASKGDLEKHTLEIHEPKEEQITDPLSFVLESMRLALNLDENGKTKLKETKRSQEALQAPAMKTSASAQGRSGVKQEVATPMSRNLTGTGPSPSTNSLKTPQASGNIKTPASESKQSIKDAPKLAAKAPETATLDPWSNSNVPRHYFSSIFRDVADLNHPVSTDFLTSWLDRTPPSIPSSPDAGDPSPHPSDVGVNDHLNINITGAIEDKNWLPADWFDDGLPGDLAALDMGQLGDMDWETVFGKEADEEGNERGY